MKSTLTCLECILNQAGRAGRIATQDPAALRQILNETAGAIPSMDLDMSPGWLSLTAFEAAKKHSGNADPYYALKREQNAMALALEDDLRQLVRESPDRLEAALHIAAAGNVIDLGTMPEHELGSDNIRRVVERVMHERFSVDHSAAFKKSLAGSESILYLLDNAGEIVFDKILIEELLHHATVTAVVKAGPIINDALIEDADEVGLTKICEVIDNGGAFVGSPLHAVSETFLAHMRAADMIVAKGQGNYETVDEFPGDVFLILRAKCEVIAQHMGVKYGQVGLISTRLRQQMRNAGNGSARRDNANVAGAS